MQCVHKHIFMTESLFILQSVIYTKRHYRIKTRKKKRKKKSRVRWKIWSIIALKKFINIIYEAIKNNNVVAFLLLERDSEEATSDIQCSLATPELDCVCEFWREISARQRMFQMEGRLVSFQHQQMWSISIFNWIMFSLLQDGSEWIKAQPRKFFWYDNNFSLLHNLYFAVKNLFFIYKLIKSKLALGSSKSETLKMLFASDIRVNIVCSHRSVNLSWLNNK